MEIYVSEKEDCFRLIKKLKPIESGYIAVITPLDGTDASIFIKEVESLEQHEAEVRKPLEDKIVQLEKLLGQDPSKDWVAIEKTEFDKIKLGVKEIIIQERQKVIAELEEWVELNMSIAHVQHDTANYEYIKLEKLKQKLKEMKGEHK